MLIFAKKNLGFRNPETNQIVTVKALDMITVPDWVEKDPMFQWALSDGSISVNTTPKDAEDEPKAEVPTEHSEAETEAEVAAPKKRQKR